MNSCRPSDPFRFPFRVHASRGVRRSVRPRRAQLHRRRALTTGCSSCSRTATRPASGATRCRRCYRGDQRYADRLGDLFSDAHYQAEKAAAEQDLAALHAIPRDQLNATDKIAYDVFEDQTAETCKASRRTCWRSPKRCR